MFDLEDFKYNSVNITAFRLVDTENPAVADVVEQMRKFQSSGQSTLNSGNKILQVKVARFCGTVQVNFVKWHSLN